MSIENKGSAAVLEIDGSAPNGARAEWHSTAGDGDRHCSGGGADQAGLTTDEPGRMQAIDGEGGLGPPGARQASFAFSRRLVCLSAPNGATAASYRSLQTHLLARHVGAGRRALAVCSPQPATGCTTVAVNLAVACAQAGINTLLVDANLVRPAVHQFIRPADGGTAGLAQMLLADPANQVDAICRNVLPNLAVLFAGGLPPSDLVVQRRFKEVVDHCMRSFDFTIVDTPPASDGAHARHVAMAVRYAMMVVRRDVTFLADMKKTTAELTNDRVSLLGSFLTDF